MKHVRAIFLKLVATLSLLYVILGIGFGLPFPIVLTLTLFLGIISYLLGDLLLLPRASNLLATISDFALSFIIVWFYLSNLANTSLNLFFVSVLTSIALSAFEFLFHKYMESNVFEQQTERQVSDNLHFQTEASEELYPLEATDKGKDTKE